MKNKKVYDAIVIGGGAAGMMSAIFAGRRGLKVLLLEHNEKLGKKLFITGKGRCNITNLSDNENHFNNIVTNPKFMYSALNNFDAYDTVDFFNLAGLETKVERGNRVFPSCDKSSDVIKTLENELAKASVQIALNTNVVSVTKEKDLFNILCMDKTRYTAKSVVVATGGVSYMATGSTGDGYTIAKNFGHTVIPCKSALCPIKVKEDISTLNGLSLKNVSLAIKLDKKIFKQQGEMMFTYSSLTGPIALTLSSLINKYDIKDQKIYLDFKPALSSDKLTEKFKREFVSFAKKDLKNYLFSLLPSSMVDYFMQKCGLANKKLADLTKTDRDILIKGLKEFDFSLVSLDNINVSIITSGGVNVKEIDAKTCESKLVSNLYFIGEVLDVDALTGGYNLQIAWSTGVLAGRSLKGDI